MKTKTKTNTKTNPSINNQAGTTPPEESLKADMSFTAQANSCPEPVLRSYRIGKFFVVTLITKHIKLQSYLSGYDSVVAMLADLPFKPDIIRVMEKEIPYDIAWG